MKALEILNDKLVGFFIHSFRVGDNWTLDFGDYYLSAQNLISPDEGMLNEWLQTNYKSFETAVDKDYVAKSTIVAAHMRKEVKSVTLDKDYNLTLYFENDSELVLPTRALLESVARSANFQFASPRCWAVVPGRELKVRATARPVH